MRIYGLTGGTGSGKSEAGRRFSELGIPVIDADAIGHEVIAPGGAAEKDVIAAFGEDIVSHGAIDRAKLGARIFADNAARRRLNGLVHPAIRMEIAARCAELAEKGSPIAIIDAALIGENGRRDEFLSGIILVLCPEEERVRRLVRSRGLSEDEARRRVASQTPPEAKLAIADWVIENKGTLEKLYTEVDRIADELRRHDA